MIDQFNWPMMPSKKVALAALLCDIELLPEDFDILKTMICPVWLKRT